MSETPCFLSYRYNGWLIEFYPDHVEATNPATRDRYEIRCDPYEPNPFLILLVEKGQ